jgi:hypothetical protein
MTEQERAAAAEEPPIACALSGAELARRGEDVRELFRGVEQVSELADGYAFRFPGDDREAVRLLEFTLAERSCCPFFTFELVFEPNLGPIWVRLRGSDGVKDFVASAWGEVLAAHA